MIKEVKRREKLSKTRRRDRNGYYRVGENMKRGKEKGRKEI